MIKRFLIFLILSILLFPLISCGKKEETREVQPVRKVKPVQQAPAPAEAISAAAPIASTIEARERNPFQSYIVLMRATEGARKVKGPLECCELGLFKLQAAVESPDNAFALVQAPDGKRYIVRRGDVMGLMGGKVIVIRSKSITVREVNKQDGKVISTADTELKLPSERGQ